MENIFVKYTEELNQDTKLDRLNVLEVQSMLPAIKHKWVARLINHKKELDKLRSLEKKAKDKIVENLKQTSPVALTGLTFEKKAEENEIMQKIHSQIKEQELICVYLEKVEKIFQTMTYDIKNMVDIIKLEET